MGACACVYVSGKCLSTISVVLSPFHEVRGGGGGVWKRSYGLCRTERRLLKDMTGRN